MNFKVTFALFLLIVFACEINAQGFRFDDPNVIFKDAKGVTLSPDSAKSMAANGRVNIKTSTADDGKTIIVFTPIPLNDSEKMAKDEKDWMEKKLNSQFPAFSLATIDNQKVSNVNFKGKFAVLNFWFLGCKPCLEEIPELNKLVTKYTDNGISFLAPALDKPEAIKTFLKKREFKYTVLAGAEALADTLGIRFYPTHIIVDREGNIKEIVIGGSADIFLRLDDLIQKTIDINK